MSLQISERLNATDINGVKADYRSYAKTFTEQGFTSMSWTEWLIAHLKGELQERAYYKNR